jgi:ParB-like chromosome segregation protein Spo0J
MAKIDIKSAISVKTQQTLNNSYISTEQIKQKIVILDELLNFITPLAEEEFKQLEYNIQANGCKDSILLWGTTQNQINGNDPTIDSPAYVLIDGHNRYKICTKHGIPFNIQVMSFESIKIVKDYMIDLQLGRRNLSPQQASYFRGIRYNLEKEEKGKYDRVEHKSQNDTYALEANKNVSTSEKLAKQFNVSRATIMRDAEFAKGLESLNPDVKNEILSGKIKIDKTNIQKLAKNNTNQEETLEVILTKNIEAEQTKEINDFEVVQEQLKTQIKKLLNTKKMTPDILDQMIELVNEFKKVL